ncbi:hypothetical protein [Streptomyces gelaticus]|nr:hypothetical protein [Streptomyces gelaticus]
MRATVIHAGVPHGSGVAMCARSAGSPPSAAQACAVPDFGA